MNFTLRVGCVLCVSVRASDVTNINVLCCKRVFLVLQRSVRWKIFHRVLAAPFIVWRMAYLSFQQCHEWGSQEGASRGHGPPNGENVFFNPLSSLQQI